MTREQRGLFDHTLPPNYLKNRESDPSPRTTPTIILDESVKETPFELKANYPLLEEYMTIHGLKPLDRGEMFIHFFRLAKDINLAHVNPHAPTHIYINLDPNVLMSYAKRGKTIDSSEKTPTILAIEEHIRSQNLTHRLSRELDPSRRLRKRRRFPQASQSEQELPALSMVVSALFAHEFQHTLDLAASSQWYDDPDDYFTPPYLTLYTFEKLQANAERVELAFLQGDPKFHSLFLLSFRNSQPNPPTNTPLIQNSK